MPKSKIQKVNESLIEQAAKVYYKDNPSADFHSAHLSEIRMLDSKMYVVLRNGHRIVGIVVVDAPLRRLEGLEFDQVAASI